MGIALKGIELATAMGINRGLIAIAKKKGHLILNEEGLFEIENEKNKSWIKSQTTNGYVFDIHKVELDRANKSMRVYKTIKPKEPKKVVVSEPKKVIVEYISARPTIEQQIKEEQGRSQLTPKGKANSVKSGDNIHRSKSDSVREKSDEINNKFFEKDDNDILRDEKLSLEVEKLKNSDRLEKLKIAKIEGELLPVDAVETIFLWAVEEFKKTYEQDCDNVANIFIKILGGTQSNFIEIKKMLMEAQSQVGITFKESLLTGLKNQISEYSEVRSRGERR